MSNADSYSLFSEQLLGIQKGLYAYILTLLPWREEASDVLQQTNLVLWRDAERYRPGTDFRAWAYRVAYFQVLAQRKKVRREHLRFDDALLDTLAASMDRETVVAEEEALALQDCMKLLPEGERELICRRYDAGVSVKIMAAEANQSPNALAVKLHRVRQKLLDCLQQHASQRE
jgi:RNA polymerase sigma-70 factor (ECF subfamily)